MHEVGTKVGTGLAGNGCGRMFESGLGFEQVNDEEALIKRSALLLGSSFATKI
jgi:hypothetical protein